MTFKTPTGHSVPMARFVCLCKSYLYGDFIFKCYLGYLFFRFKEMLVKILKEEKCR